MILPPEPILIALSAGRLLSQATVAEEDEDGHTGVVAQKEDQPWSHAMGPNSTSWLSGKVTDT